MTSPKRIALLGFHLESNSFAPVSGEWDFRSLCYMAGGEISADMVLPNPSLPTEIPAFAAEMHRTGTTWKPIPILVTAAEPGGPVDHAFFLDTVAEMERLFGAFHTMCTGDGEIDEAAAEEFADDMDKLRVLSGVKQFPMRVKCATLAWHTINAAIHDQHDATTE